MNCFQWQNHLSDFLDKTLPSHSQLEAESHLKSCPSCKTRYKHYLEIIKNISYFSKSTLPVPIRRSPMLGLLPKVDFSRIQISHWQQIPWAIRIALESFVIVTIIVLSVTLIPKIRQIQDKNAERSLTDFTKSLEAQNLTLHKQDRQNENRLPSNDEFRAETLPLLRGKTNGNTTEQDDTYKGEVDFEADNEGIEESDEISGSVSVDIWRFFLKTDSTTESRPKIIKLLTDLHVPRETPGLGGIEVPGGIQFDLILPIKTIPLLKKRLQDLPPLESQDTEDEIAVTATADEIHGIGNGTELPWSESFTWYKSKTKSNRAIPEGKARVVIWLSLR